jgi:bifunctional NMN adenylyltransferase/nudix hydrolase
LAKKSGTGIIVGRFQVVALNKIHQKLLKQVTSKHEQVVVFLCDNPAPSDAHPIDYVFRVEMFDALVNDQFEVLDMPDLPDDRIWSQELDRRILELRPAGNVTLYGTREGFTERYSGRYTTEILEADEAEVNALEDAPQSLDMTSFRAGMLYATMRRFPTVYPTVDICVYNEETNEILLARKEYETKWRFPGGFTDPDDVSFEEAALRELTEECGKLEVGDMVYLGSTAVDDWRYIESSDSIITHFYICKYESGNPEALDDIAEVKWCKMDKLREDMFVAEHRPLYESLVFFFKEMDELGGLEEEDGDGLF